MSEPTPAELNQPGHSRVLLVSDVAVAIASLRAQLDQESGFVTSVSQDPEEGMARAKAERPSLVVIDLPELAETLEFCRALKANSGTRRIPVIILSAANDIADRIAGLEAGADDYIGKPCNPREVILRMKAVLRRGTRPVMEEQVVRGPIRVDPGRCQVAVENQCIHLTAVEFKLLRALVQQAGQVQSREALLSEARGQAELALESRTIDTHIRRLRGKLGKAAYLVETVRGSGYRLRSV